MENSQPLASESFSFSWLIDEKFPFDGVLEPHRASIADSIEISTKEANHMDMDVQSHRFFNEAHENFNFYIPVSQSCAVLVHADEIFSDGHMMPVYLDRSKIQQPPSSAPATPTISSFSPENVLSGNKNHGNFLRKWWKSSIRILQKCSGFLRPICQRLTCSRESVRVDDLGRKAWEVQSWRNSLQPSPTRSVTYSAINWAEIMQTRGKLDMHSSLDKVKSGSYSSQASSPLRSPSTDVIYGAESPIYEAILHCKRSIEN